MKTKYALLLLLATLTACQSNSDGDETNNLELVLEEFDYFENAIPFRSTPYSENLNHDEIAALGRILFYDTRLSQNNSIACASCHKQELGFADGERFSLGVRNYETKRNAMALVNNAFQISHFWEGHSGQIDDHVLNPISNHIEMGMKSIDELVEKLSEIDEYNKLFNKVFHGEEISGKSINTALSTFVASIISYNSKFDKGEKINFTNFTLAEQEGKSLFFGKANCSNCHKGDHYSASWRMNTNIGLDMEYEDQGAGYGKFKVPSLRNIALTSPYMHDGRFQTLEEVVNHYVNGINDHPSLDWALNEPIVLSELEQNQLIEFLHTLTDYHLISDKKFSNPF
jgi:cytochrome c peroxidase